MDLPFLSEHQIITKLSTIKDSSSLPMALQRMLELIITGVESPEELETFVRLDPGLAARIVRIANSACYGSQGKFLDLSGAILSIGCKEAKSICIFALATQIFAEPGPIVAAEREELWKHSFTTARLAQDIALQRPWMPPNQAYLLGLLHDFGRIILAAYFPEHYRAIRTLAQERNVPAVCVEPQFNLVHTTIGSMISKRWAMPELVRNAMEFHHEPQKSPSFRPEVELVALANILANSGQFPGYLDDGFTRMYRNALCISDEEWEHYQNRLTEILSETDQFWHLLE